MIPQYISEAIKDNKRNDTYELLNDISLSDFYKHTNIFNINEFDFKTNQYQYLTYDVVMSALQLKVDLIFAKNPEIKFESSRTQKDFDLLRQQTNFDEKISKLVLQSLIFGDGIIKIITEKNNLTATDDLVLGVKNVYPAYWVAGYNEYDTQSEAKTNSLLFEKEIKDGDKKLGEAYLVESFEPGKIIYTAYFKPEDEKKEIYQIDPLIYFEDVLKGVLAKKQDDLTYYLDTNCEYSLVQRLKNKDDVEDYYGLSEISTSVVAKINALNKYANLGDFVITTNSIPLLALSESASQTLNKILEELKPQVATIPTSFTEVQPRNHISSQSYIATKLYKDVLNSLKAYPDNGRGDTHYVTNPFDLAQLREQHKIIFEALMFELGISQVFYDSSLVSGTLSGTAYKRLMTITLNEIEHLKRKLEPVLSRIVYTMLELAKNQKIITSKPEIPRIKFEIGIIEDEKENIENWILKTQNKFAPLLTAIENVNNISTEEAVKMKAEIDKETQENIALNQETVANAQNTRPSSQTDNVKGEV